MIRVHRTHYTASEDPDDVGSDRHHHTIEVDGHTWQVVSGGNYDPVLEIYRTGLNNAIAIFSEWDYAEVVD